MQPIEYRLWFRPDIYGDEPPFTLSGSVVIRFLCTKSTSLVVLNSRGLNVSKTSIALKSRPAEQLQEGDLHLDEEHQFLMINTSVPLQPGRKYTFRARFTGRFPRTVFANTMLIN